MIEIRDGQVIVTLAKCILVMGREQFIACLRRGKAYRRATAMKARQGPNATK
jgi:hypothetical protein